MTVPREVVRRGTSGGPLFLLAGESSLEVVTQTGADRRRAQCSHTFQRSNSAIATHEKEERCCETGVLRENIAAKGRRCG